MSIHGEPLPSGSTHTSGFGPGPPPGTGYAVPGGPGAAPARPNRGLPIVLGVLAVVVLCVGGAAAAYFFLADGSPADRPTAVTSPSESESRSEPVAAPPAPASSAPPRTKQPAGGEEEVSGDLSGYKQGDCLTVDEAADNRVAKAKCTDPGAQRVLLRRNGTLDDATCESAGATFSLSQDAPGSTKDFILCVGPAD